MALRTLSRLTWRISSCRNRAPGSAIISHRDVRRVLTLGHFLRDLCKEAHPPGLTCHVDFVYVLTSTFLSLLFL
ncbi:hypothetical protein BDZ89DRAFT_1058776 [Hymenopellis radicata]|nr:hypothetical protein BDZ89DRAFT_1058776 [Hymenopellis radicata]